MPSFSVAMIHEGSNKYGAGGTCEGPDDVLAVADAGFKSWLSLLPSPSSTQVPLETIERAGLKFAQVDVQAPNGLTYSVAAAVCEAFASLPGPVMVTCATGNRASAAIALYVGKSNDWSATKTLEWATSEGLKFIGTQPLRNWVGSYMSTTQLPAGQNGLFIRQLFEPVSSTYTYILADPTSREAVIIDPVLEKAERDATLARELGLTLTVALNTHVHADHVSGTAKLKMLIPGLKSAIAGVSGAAADLCLSDGDVVTIGSRHLTVHTTPGHTDGCVSFATDDKSAVFTGDALLIRGCGRTDFQEGSATKLYQSIHDKIFTLPDFCIVYPGHDYNGHLSSTVGEEKALNNRLGYGRTQAEFETIMANLSLAPPKQLAVAVPANMLDGNAVQESGRPAADAVIPPPCQSCRQDGNGPNSKAS